MELIRPNFEIWEQEPTLKGIWKQIARCTRVCYQSIPKNNGETDEEFVKRVILRHEPWESDANHLAMLEHGTVYLYEYEEIHTSKLKKYADNKYSRYKAIYFHKEVYQDNVDYMYDFYVTTNLRVLVENNWLNDLKYFCTPTEYHVRRVTVSFITNIGVTREFNRHRVNSMAEESTRYCNYAKNKQISTSSNSLGSSTMIHDVAPINGHIRYGLPAWLLDEEHLPYIESHQFDTIESYCKEILNSNNDINPECWRDIDYYLFALTVNEWCYNRLIKKGWIPQQAREVLPLATKSQLIHTAFIDDWIHFIRLRAEGVSGPPHPNAKLVAQPLKEEFIKRGYIQEQTTQ